MKQKFYVFGLVFLIILSIGIFSSCNKDNDNNSNSTVQDLSCWAADLPKFEYAKIFSILCEDGVFGGAVFNTVKNPETAFTNYKTDLENAGWVFDVDTSNEFVWGAVYEKGTKSMTMMIQKDGSTAQIIYISR